MCNTAGLLLKLAPAQLSSRTELAWSTKLVTFVPPIATGLSDSKNLVAVTRPPTAKRPSAHASCSCTQGSAVSGEDAHGCGDAARCQLLLQALLWCQWRSCKMYSLRQNTSRRPLWHAMLSVTSRRADREPRRAWASNGGGIQGGGRHIAGTLAPLNIGKR